MPNWKKVIVSGSDASLNSINVATNVVAQSFTGSLQGTASWALNALTSSNVQGGSQYYVPLWNTNSSLTSSYLNQSGSVLKAIYNGQDKGLTLDYNIDSFILGNAGTGNNTYIQVYDGGSVININTPNYTYFSEKVGIRIIPTNPGLAVSGALEVTGPGTSKFMNNNVQIDGNLFMSGSNRLIYNDSTTNSMLFGFFDGGNIYGPYYQIFGNQYANTTQRGSAEFVYDNRNGGGSGFNIASFNGSTWTRKFRVDDDGAQVTGSLIVTNGITGSLFGTASWANNATTASYVLQAVSASFATTASFITASNVFGPFGSNSVLTASFAQTASYALNIEVSGAITNVDYIDFDTASATPAWKSGRIFWDNTDGCLAVYNAEQDITLQVGQENWTRVRNNTGGPITNGTVVRLEGAQGDVPTITKAQSLAVSGSVNLLSQILGVATHTIEDNSFGYVTTQGLVRGLNTNAFGEGDTLFVSTTAGTLTNTAPPAPFEIIPVGITVKSGPGTSGIIYVAVQQPLDFSDLSSVEITGTYSYGDLWTYVPSGSYGVWRHTNQLSGSYGLTGSLIATSLTATSLSASSLTVANNAVVSGSLTVLQNLTVFGSASITYISQSTLNVATNLITVNTNTPGVRFGGLAVIDSGSSPQVSGSWLFDSQKDRWIMIHEQTAGSALTSSIGIMGPETYNDLGNETQITLNRLTKGYSGASGEHIGDSQISDDGTTVSIPGSLIVTGSITGSLFGTASWAQNAVTSSFITASNVFGPFGSNSIISASFAQTSSFITHLNQNVVISGSTTITGSLGVGTTGSAVVGRIDAANDVVAFSTSDENLKKNIKPIKNAIEKIEQIGGYTFDWKKDKKNIHGFSGKDVGVIAQEIETVLPEVVVTRENGYKAVRYEKIIPLLIEAIKEQQNKINELETLLKQSK